MLARNAGFTCVAVLCLAIGIGVNTAAFTAYKAFFDRPLDARDPGGMANMALILHSGAMAAWFSHPDYEAYRDRMHSMSGLVATEGFEELTLTGAGGLSQDGAGGGSVMRKLGLFPAGAINAEFSSQRTTFRYWGWGRCAGGLLRPATGRNWLRSRR
jgi:hypothetical protein